MTWLLIAALAASSALAKPESLLAKNVHNGLHRAETEPEQPPPPVLFSPEDLKELEDAEVVFRYENLKGHAVALAAATTWANRYEVWRAIKAMEQYPEYLENILSAKLDKESDKDGYSHLQTSLELKIPGGLPGEMKVEGRHYQEEGFLSFRLMDAKKNPFKHAMGYWSVTELSKGNTLVQFVIDAKPSFPIPGPQRQMIAERTMPYLVSAMCRRAESETKKREMMHREEF
jgi:ribosome-associated toxin RatA of RatAB toxin-antitoxin module